MAEDIRTNTILNGRYQVQRKLGQGGMGAVYLAEDTRNRRLVAIKVARLAGPNDRAQFRREAGYLQKLHHHGLPRVWDIFSDTQQDFLVMEYIPGEDLESLVQAQGPQPEWLVLRWAEELLDSLAFLHSQDPPIIHRDVKPGNLKLRQDETLVLVDFGIAKEFVPGMDTFAGATAITPGYSPLEQYSGANTDARSDLYAVGATIYFLLSGRTPAAAPDRATGDARLLSLLDVAPRTSPATDMLVRRAMSVSRDQRWSSAAEMRHAADLAARQLSAKTGTRAAAVPAAPAAPSQPVKAVGNPGRKRGRLALLALAMAAVLAVVLLATRGNQSPDAAVGPTLAATDAVAVAVTAPPTETATATPPQSTPTSTVLPTDTARPVAVIAAAPLAPITITEVISGPTGLVTVTRVLEPPRAGGDVPPTSTPIGTFTPTPTPTNPPPATRAPTVAAPAPAAVPSAPSGAIAVKLTSPNNGDASSAALTFEWSIASGGLAPNQAFEWRLWKVGQDPVRDGLGLAGTTRSREQRVNLATADAAAQIEPGAYQWGVLLVQTTPSYQPIELISDTRTFWYERAGGGQPAPTLPPRPTSQPTPTPRS